jgi:hypothetical protein
VQYVAYQGTASGMNRFDRLASFGAQVYTLASPHVRELNVEIGTHSGQFWTARFIHEVAGAHALAAQPFALLEWKSVITRQDRVVSHLDLEGLVMDLVQENREEELWAGLDGRRSAGSSPAFHAGAVMVDGERLPAVRLNWGGFRGYATRLRGVSVAAAVPEILAGELAPDIRLWTRGTGG